MNAAYDICQLSKTKFGVLEKRIGATTGYAVIAETKTEQSARRIADAMALTAKIKAAPDQASSAEHVRVTRPDGFHDARPTPHPESAEGRRRRKAANG